MREADYLIGIDGGATRSEGIVVTRSGEVLRRAAGRPLNRHAESLARVRSHLATLLGELTAGLPGSCRGAVIGTASVFEEAGEEERRGLVEGLAPLPPDTFVCGDAVTALHGATGGSPGLLIIAGTGSIAIALDRNGRRRTRGGLGPLLGGDPGSAFSMSCQALLAAQSATNPPSPLETAILDHLALPDLESLVEAVKTRPDPVRWVAGLGGHLARACADDPDWRAIEEEAGRALARMVRPLLGPLPDLPVYGTGSVLGANPRVRTALAAALGEQCGREVPVLEPAAGAAEGAALLARARLEPQP